MHVPGEIQNYIPDPLVLITCPAENSVYKSTQNPRYEAEEFWLGRWEKQKGRKGGLGGENLTREWSILRIRKTLE